MDRASRCLKLLRTVGRLVILITIQLMSQYSDTAALPLIETVQVGGHNSRPVDVVAAPDGSLWFTDPGSERIGRITSGGAIFSIPLDAESGPTGIALGEEGDLWVTLNDANAILRIAPASRQIVAEYSLPSEAAQPFAVAAADGGGVWFTEIGANSIGRLSLTGNVEEFLIPSDLAVPGGITTAHGAVWFTEFNRNRIGRLDGDGSMMEIQLPNPGSGPFGIVAADGGVWFTELGGNRIGHIDLAGVLTELDVPTPASQPAGITVGPDGGIWFTQINADRVGRVAGDEIIEIGLETGSFTAGTLFGGGIASGPGNRISFAASEASAIQAIGFCGVDSDCGSGNCDDSRGIGLCGPAHTPTPTNGDPSCQSDTSCPQGFFCNLEEGRICCDMPVCPAGFTCRLPNREGFCSALPTPSPIPTSTIAAPTATSTRLASATASPRLPTPTTAASIPISPSPVREPSMTPAVTATGQGSGGGCSIDRETAKGVGLQWGLFALPFLLFAAPRFVGLVRER
jgi:virginiamycin B lyase